ncbi:hypothetical protein BIZ38_18455 [Pseudoalteromonas sp. BZK2]|uniref:hypothetical protein n=1 Tax=Pseudoalteromonas sp. BZK2 TaxID=1904458 RepID=UPI0016548DAC|nr:hypothetical protein [Pseudoalteromonas sp. BZK2]MBC7010430.1 hypothetical protein [Pseudoalteromonas sp. BZK2]
MKLKKNNTNERMLGRLIANELKGEELEKVHGGAASTLAAKGYTDSGKAGDLSADCDRQA